MKDQVQDPSPTAHCEKNAKRARHFSPAQPAVPRHAGRVTSNIHSDRSHKSGTQAPANKQRRSKYETPAALADPLGAFACSAGHKQRALQSGLRLLQGKASQARVVSSGLQPPNEQPAVQVDSQDLQQQRSTIPPQATVHRQHSSHTHPRQQLPSAPRQHVAETAGQSHSRVPGQSKSSQAGRSRPQVKEVQADSAGQSVHGVSSGTVQDLPQACKQIDSNYFQQVRSSLHHLIQAHHGIPSLHTMSDSDRAALTSLLSHKLDGVNITNCLERQHLPKPQPDQHPAQLQQPSTASSVDCTPSPESVVQQQKDVRACKLPGPALPVQDAQNHGFPSSCVSHASQASAASSGSDHRRFTQHQMHHGARPDFFHDMFDACDGISCDIQDSMWHNQGLDMQVNARASGVSLGAEHNAHAFTESPKFDWYANQT